MREKILASFGVLGIFLAGVITSTYLKPKEEKAAIDPFRKVGVLATKNGLVAELFKVESCYVLVTTAPMEMSRGMFQLECE